MKRHILAASVGAALLAGSVYAGEITLYTAPHFRGGELTLNGAASNLDRSGYNDRSESIIVRSGRWEVCTDANFSGQCVLLNPGDYPVLRDPIYKRISSAREVGPYASTERYYRYAEAPRVYSEPVYVAPPVTTYVQPAPVYDARTRYGALELYTLPGFRGSTMKFDNSATTLDKRMTDEGIGSIVVREGIWELCTGLDFNGSCRTYEPGRYARLGNFDGAGIGSLRRIG